MTLNALAHRIRRAVDRLTRPRSAIFNPHAFWERRHRLHRQAMTGVGNVTLSIAQNEADYAVKLARVLASIEQAIGPMRGRSILDAGCGIGLLTEVLVREGAHVTAVDFSAAALALAKHKLPAVEFVCGSIDEMPYEAQFDAAVSMDVLFHIVDDGKWELALSRLATAIKPEGSIIIQDALSRAGQPGPPHVRWRSLETYRRAYSLLGAEICNVENYSLPHEKVSKDILTIKLRS